MSGNHAVFEKFIEHIQKASELQTLTTKFVENEEDELNFNSLTNRLKELNIKDNFPLYEIYLRFLSSFPFKRPKLNFIYTKIYQIIDYLIEEQEMKAKFHYTTIFNIFEYNKTLILYAYNKGLFDLEPIERKILTREDIDLLTFFIPEILEKDEDFFNTKLTQFYVNKKAIVESFQKDPQGFYEARKTGHSNEEIAKIIQNDDIDKFIEYVSQKNYSLNSKIPPSIFESDLEINRNYSSGLSLLNYSMAFGAVKIFKYLLMNDAQLKYNSFLFAIIGGNLDIIHIFEKEAIVNFKEIGSEFISQSYSYHYPSIAEYIMSLCDLGELENNIGKGKYSVISLKVQNSICSFDFSTFLECLNDDIGLEYFLNEYYSDNSLYDCLIETYSYLFYTFLVEYNAEVSIITTYRVHL